MSTTTLNHATAATYVCYIQKTSLEYLSRSQQKKKKKNQLDDESLVAVLIFSKLLSSIPMFYN
jgi:hypothetical protein